MSQQKNIIPGNFQENLTRLRGALLSLKKAAYIALLIKILRPFFNILDYLIALFKRTSALESELPKMIMIVSPPRSGSTIIFQSLARTLPVIYISNLHLLFPQNATKQVQKRKGTLPLKSKNFYGHTSSLVDVNEGNEFIHPIFAKTGDPGEIRIKFLGLLRKLRLLSASCFVFKNTHSYKHIKTLSSAFPELVFIRINRNPEQVIQSEYRAYQELGTFNPIPESLRESSITDPLEFTVHQILEIDKEIDIQKKHVNSKNWIEWVYEEFCEDPSGHIERLALETLELELSDLQITHISGQIKVSNNKKVSDEDEKRIMILMADYKRKQKNPGQ